MGIEKMPGGTTGEENTSIDEPADGPEPVGVIVERVIDDLETRQRQALNRLARAHRPRDTP